MIRFGLFLLCSVVAAWAAPESLLPGAPPAMYSSAIPFKDIEGGIVNGSSASRGQFPWQAALHLVLNNGTYSFCGGALISPSWILTAAQCTAEVRFITAYLGFVSLNNTSELVTAFAERIFVHPDYSASTLLNDIALIQLTSSVATSPYVSPVNLASSILQADIGVTVSSFGRTSDSTSTGIPKEYDSCGSGFGIYNITELHYFPLVTTTNSICAMIYNDSIKSGMVCALGATIESICNSEKGDPLIAGNGFGAVHVGIFSRSYENCAKGYPMMFTRTSKYRSWISSVAGV